MFSADDHDCCQFDSSMWQSVLYKTLHDQSLSLTCSSVGGFLHVTLFSSIKNTNKHDIIVILYKVVLNNNYNPSLL